MKLTHIFEAGSGFKILETTKRSQTGLLTLEPGEASSDEPSVHDESDQVLVVLQGMVTGEIGRERKEMKVGDAVVVAAGTPHNLSIAARSARSLSAFTQGRLSRRIKQAPDWSSHDFLVAIQLGAAFSRPVIR